MHLFFLTDRRNYLSETYLRQSYDPKNDTNAITQRGIGYPVDYNLLGITLLK